MKKQVVANTSSLVFLAKLDIFHLAKNMFSEILVPKQVIKELFVKENPEVSLIKKNLGEFLIEVNVKNIKVLPLGEGERAAISFCLQNNIKTFLSDDKKARKFARFFECNTIGVLGILLWNLKKKKINKQDFLRLFNSLIENGYYISAELYSKVMQLIDGFGIAKGGKSFKRDEKLLDR